MEYPNMTLQVSAQTNQKRLMAHVIIAALSVITFALLVFTLQQDDSGLIAMMLVLALLLGAGVEALLLLKIRMEASQKQPRQTKEPQQPLAKPYKRMLMQPAYVSYACPGCHTVFDTNNPYKPGDKFECHNCGRLGTIQKNRADKYTIQHRSCQKCFHQFTAYQEHAECPRCHHRQEPEQLYQPAPAFQEPKLPSHYNQSYEEYTKFKEQNDMPTSQKHDDYEAIIW